MKARGLGVLALLVVVAASALAARENRGWIGLAGGRFEQRADGTAGLVVQSVAPNSPASRGGLRANDVITSIDGRPVSDREEVLAAFAQVRAMQRVRFVVLRENRLIVVQVKAEPRLEQRAKR